MKIRYFSDTGTLYIEFRDVPVSETRDLDENTTLDIDAQGDISAIRVEHASKRAGSLSSLVSRSPRTAPDCFDRSTWSEWNEVVESRGQTAWARLQS